MARRTGVSSTTPTNVIVDAGAVYIDYGEASERLLGATRGGNTFTVTQDFRTIEADGIPGSVSAMVRIINVTATLEVNLLEYNKDNFAMIFPGATITDYPALAGKTHDSIRRTQNVSSADFFTNVALVGTVQGKTDPVICILYNAISLSNLTLAMADDDESVTTVTFTAHFDLNDLDTEPWEIRYPTS